MNKKTVFGLLADERWEDRTMNQKIFALALGAMLFALDASADAQPSGKVCREQKRAAS